MEAAQDFIGKDLCPAVDITAGHKVKSTYLN